MKMPSREIIQRLREQYPQGTQVELVSMTDPYRTIPPGTKGIVDRVDDIGTVFVQWDTGSTLGVVYGVDEIKFRGDSNEQELSEPV